MWVIAEDHTSSALALRRAWVLDDVELIAPPIFRPEVTSVIRLTVFRVGVAPAQAARALEAALAWPVQIAEDSDDLQRRAYTIATTYEHPRAYEAQYLALAQLQGCEFWTGDQRLINALRGQFPWAHWIGEHQSA